MAENEVTKSFSFVNGTPKVIIDGLERNISYNDEWQPFQPEGFTWRTAEYENIDKTKEDLAIGRIRPGGRIAVEMNVQSISVPKKHKFWEVWLSGKAKYLVSKPGKTPKIYEFGFGGSNEPNSFLIEQGTIFCIFADIDQKNDVFFYETELPGFEESALPHIEADTSEYQGHSISPEFWNIFHKLNRGLKFNPDGTVVK